MNEVDAKWNFRSSEDNDWYPSFDSRNMRPFRIHFIQFAKTIWFFILLLFIFC